jgi:hypothetical protein
MNLTEEIKVRVTPDQKRAIRHRARALGISLSEFIRVITTGTPRVAMVADVKKTGRLHKAKVMFDEISIPFPIEQVI